MTNIRPISLYGNFNWQALHRPLLLANSDLVLPDISGADHTMKGALPLYVHQKFPNKLLEEALEQGVKIEVHGTYPMRSEVIFDALGYTHIEKFRFKHNPAHKKYNYIRPSFWIARAPDPPHEKRLLIAVTPGSDYIRHYSEMLQYIIAARGYNPDEYMEVIRYPAVEDFIAEWTGLDENFVSPGDRVILGYVDELEVRLATENKALKREGQFEFIGGHENEYYGSRKYKTRNGEIVNFLGAKYSYWGNISNRVVRKLCRLGASEIIYMAKQGVLTSPGDVYGRLFAAHEVFAVDGAEVSAASMAVRNALLERFPDLGTAFAHCSVPTVPGETFEQRATIVGHNGGTIDNEIQSKADAIGKYNQTSNRKPVRATFLHFGTDYLYASDEPYDQKRLNLSVNRTDFARAGKHTMISFGADHLREYLQIPLDHLEPNVRNMTLPDTDVKRYRDDIFRAIGRKLLDLLPFGPS